MAETRAESSDKTESENETKGTKSWWTLQRIVTIAVVAFIGLYVLLFLVGFVAALVWGRSASAFFQYFRDLMTIALTISGIAVVVGIGVLIIQIARFVNLVRSEIKPISEDTRQAFRNVRVTTEFVQKHAVAPIIKFQAFLAGLIAFLREIIHITQLLQRKQTNDEAPESNYKDEA